VKGFHRHPLVFNLKKFFYIDSQLAKLGNLIFIIVLKTIGYNLAKTLHLFRKLKSVAERYFELPSCQYIISKKFDISNRLILLEQYTKILITSYMLILHVYIARSMFDVT